MKLELKNIKYAAFASEETPCFEASVYIDGKKAGTVRNSGRGAPDDFQPRALEEQIDQYAATLPNFEKPTVCQDDYPYLTVQTTGSLIAIMLDDWIALRHLKRLCSKKTLYRIPGIVYIDGEYHTQSCKFTQSVKTSLLAKYGEGLVFLNESFI